MYCIVCTSPKKPAFLYRSRDRMYGLPGEFQIRRCETCGLLSLYPRLDRRRIPLYYPSSHYYSYVDEGRGVFHKLRNYLIKRFYYPTLFSKLFMSFINTVPAIPPLRRGGKLMDVGCGNGETLRNLRPYGWDLYGVDIDAKAVRSARRKGLHHVYKGDYSYLSKFPDGYFDVIRSYHVIEHLDDPKRFIEISYRKLKTGGEFICGTPNGRSIQAGIFRSYWYNLDTPRHQYIFTPENLQLLITKAKFSVTDIQFCAGGGVLGSLQNILSQLLQKKLHCIDNPFLFFLFYPFDWLSDKMHLGDVFVVTARK